MTDKKRFIRIWLTPEMVEKIKQKSGWVDVAITGEEAYIDGEKLEKKG